MYGFLTEKEYTIIFRDLLEKGLERKSALGTSSDYFENPITSIARGLHDALDLEKRKAHEKTAKTIKALEEEGVIECLRAGGVKIRSIKIFWNKEPFRALYEEYKNETKKLREEKIKKESIPPSAAKEDAKKSAPARNTTVEELPPDILREKQRALRNIQKRKYKKGLIREIRALNERGDRSETKVEKVIKRAAEIIHELPAGVRIEIKRSKKHNERKGRIVMEDLRGEDINIFISVPEKETPYRIIYNVKSSKKYANEFNKEIRTYESQKDAALKKAITGNTHKPQKRIAQEFLQDLEDCGIRRIAPYKEKILAHFFT